MFLRDEEVKNHSDDSSNKDYGGRELVVSTRTEASKRTWSRQYDRNRVEKTLQATVGVLNAIEQVREDAWDEKVPSSER